MAVVAVFFFTGLSWFLVWSVASYFNCEQKAWEESMGFKPTPHILSAKKNSKNF